MVFKKRFASSSKHEVALLIAVLVAAGGLILVNYLTIKILSSTRSYANGESRYSKGQKDAARSLIMFINTEEQPYWDTFLEEMSVPVGDSIARVGLTVGASDSIIRAGFLAGRNHPDDVDDLIWMFRNFSDIAFMKKAIQIWKEADVLIGKEIRLAQTTKQKMDVTPLSDGEKQSIIQEVNTLTIALTVKERAFAETVGSASREVKSALMIFNVVFTLLIMSGTSVYAWLMFRQLREKNQDLLSINEELDKFVYSASHDLRAPLTSMQGLIELAKIQSDPEQIKVYLQLMEQSLQKQDDFIRDIIDFSRNKRTALTTKDIDLAKVIDDVIQQHMYMEDARGITISKEVALTKVRSDELRIKIILNNLLSNAIKYSDPKKDDRAIIIRTQQNNGTFQLQVEDNGLGIRKEDQGRIFDMFFVTNHAHKGSGLGLYITQETVQKLNGKITVESQFGIGTTFSIALPHHGNTV